LTLGAGPRVEIVKAFDLPRGLTLVLALAEVLPMPWRASGLQASCRPHTSSVGRRTAAGTPRASGRASSADGSVAEW